MPASDSISLPEFVTSPVIVVLMGWYLVLSCLAFLVFAHDKRAARTRRSRVPERRLHLLELLGGFPGAWLAIFMFHHKSSKGSFLVVTVLASAVNLLVLFGVLKVVGVVS